MLILDFRPFKVGDYVEAGGDEGIIQEVAVFRSRSGTFISNRVKSECCNLYDDRLMYRLTSAGGRLS